jgi:hypothetical protein
MTNRAHAWQLMVDETTEREGRPSRAAAFALTRQLCNGCTWADTTEEDHMKIIRRLSK